MNVVLDPKIWKEIGATEEIADWEFANAISVKDYRNNIIGNNLIHLKTLIAQVEEEPVDISDPDEIELARIYVPVNWWDHLKYTLYKKNRLFKIVFSNKRILFDEVVTQKQVIRKLVTYRNCPHMLKSDIEDHINFLEEGNSNVPAQIASA